MNERNKAIISLLKVGGSPLNFGNTNLGGGAFLDCKKWNWAIWGLWIADPFSKIWAQKEQLGNHMSPTIRICDFQNEQNQTFVLRFIEERLLLGFFLFLCILWSKIVGGETLNFAGLLWVLVLPLFDVRRMTSIQTWWDRSKVADRGNLSLEKRRFCRLSLITEQILSHLVFRWILLQRAQVEEPVKIAISYKQACMYTGIPLYKRGCGRNSGDHCGFSQLKIIYNRSQIK